MQRSAFWKVSCILEIVENLFLDYRSRWGAGGETYECGSAKQLALTFDDGPNEPHTQQLLEILAEFSVTATFFMVGKYVSQRPDIARAVAEAGHSIGNHTMNHLSLVQVSNEKVRYQIESCQDAIQNAVGFLPGIFRPPYGHTSPSINDIAQSLGLKTVLWSVVPEDWDPSVSSDRIVDRVRAAIASRRQGEIILLHDGDGDAGFGANRERTVSASRQLLKYYSTEREFIAL
jgi:peptidoglycan/xylan/chitin deacetylase (PgdA/CDA1 family)